MTLPAQFVFEEEPAKGVAVWDATAILPRGPGAYPNRGLWRIKRIYLHKSGANGPAGWLGAVAMAKYTTQVRGWPGAPYQFWLPREPDIDAEGRLVVLRTQRSDVRSYHTGGDANGHGEAVCFQGNYDSQWDLLDTGLPAVDVRPSDAQMEMAEALTAWRAELLGLDLTYLDPDDGLHALSGHWEAPKPKPVCPGDAIRLWVEIKRGSFTAHPSDLPGSPKSVPVKTVNGWLVDLGYKVGDGSTWDYDSRVALEQFQKAHGLVVDGWFGPRTLAALRAAVGL